MLGVCIPAVLGVGILIYLLGFRDTWERDHVDALLQKYDEAKEARTKGNTDIARSKYQALFDLVGRRRISDQRMKRNLADAREELVQLETAYKAEQLARERGEMEAAAARQRAQDAIDIAIERYMYGRWAYYEKTFGVGDSGQYDDRVMRDAADHFEMSEAEVKHAFYRAPFVDWTKPGMPLTGARP